MDAVTYPQESVISFVEEHVVPTRLIISETTLSEDFIIKWTPALLILDHLGREHHRTVGFLDGEELKSNLLLGSAKLEFNEDNFERAIRHLEELPEKFPQSSSVPEALFYLGVSRYRNSNDAGHLKAAYEQLTEQYPNSAWARRAHPYRLL
ncbi:MAG: tetratricopeptide repeat protein [Desulfobulbaceae bacterium]|nr:tetratricopeptide repeat protein [Desulfobulbaceae bacterium]